MDQYHERGMDVEHASREDLLALIGAQQATIAQQQASIQALESAVRELEARLEHAGPRAMLGMTPPSVDPMYRRPRASGACTGSGGAGPSRPEAAWKPNCGGAASELWRTRPPRSGRYVPASYGTSRSCWCS